MTDKPGADGDLLELLEEAVNNDEGWQERAKEVLARNVAVTACSPPPAARSPKRLKDELPPDVTVGEMCERIRELEAERDALKARLAEALQLEAELREDWRAMREGEE